MTKEELEAKRDLKDFEESTLALLETVEDTIKLVAIYDTVIENLISRENLRTYELEVDEYSVGYYLRHLRDFKEELENTAGFIKEGYYDK